jgi:hypothetical protein
MRFEHMAVGRPFQWRDSVTRQGRDEFILDWDPAGYILIAFLRGMTDREAKILDRNKVRVSAIVKGACVMPIWRWAGSQLYAETPFDPTVYLPLVPGAKEQLLRSNLVTLVGVDSTTIITRVLKVANLPQRFIDAAHEAWKGAWDDLDYSAKYAQWRMELTSEHSLDRLVAQAEYLGCLGDAPTRA